MQEKISQSLLLRIPCGIVTPEQLCELAKAAKRYGSSLKITNNSVKFFGLSPAARQDLREELALLATADGHYVLTPAVCLGKPNCPRAQQETLSLGNSLDRMLQELALPGKLSVGISGCPNCCTEIFVKDIGIFATIRGFTLHAGGSSGRKARPGRQLLAGLSEEETKAAVLDIARCYQQHGRPKERLGDMLDRLGWDIVTDADEAGEQGETKSHQP